MSQEFKTEDFMESEGIKFDEQLEVMRNARTEIDTLTRKIFISHCARLVLEPISYIVDAVWGAKKDGKLTSDQKDINNKVEPVVKKMEPLLNFDALEASQKYAIQYIIRELIITRLVFMVEMLKEKVGSSGESDRIDLEKIDPLGHA